MDKSISIDIDKDITRVGAVVIGNGTGAAVMGIAVVSTALGVAVTTVATVGPGVT
jgi:hypothetical protein